MSWARARNLNGRMLTDTAGSSFEAVAVVSGDGVNGDEMLRSMGIVIMDGANKRGGCFVCRAHMGLG